MRILLFLATNLAVKLAKNASIGMPEVALGRLKQESQIPDQMPDTLQAFGINRGHRSGMGALCINHPPPEQRIQALQQAQL